MADKKITKGTFDRWMGGINTVVASAIAIPVFGGVFKTLAEKGGEAVGKKISEAVGLTSEEASKSTLDDSMFEKVLADGTMNPTEIETINNYLVYLRKNDPKLAIELVKWVYNAMVQFEKKIKKSSGPKDNREEIISTDYSEGILVVEPLLYRLIAAPDNDARKDVLLGRDIKVKPKKDPPKSIKAVQEYAKDKFDEAVTGFKKNPNDFKQSANKYLADARARRKK